MTTTRLSKLAKYAANISASAALVAALALPSAAEAHGQLTHRSATLGSSEMAASTSVKFQWGADLSGVVRGIRLQVCTSPTYSQPCVKPSGTSFTTSSLDAVQGALSSGWNYSTTFTEAILTKSAGNSVSRGATCAVIIKQFTNPSSIGTFYFRVTTYTSTNLTVGAELDFGAVAVSTARIISNGASATYNNTLVFRLANQVDADCGGQTDVVDPADSSSDFVTLAPNPASLAASSVGTAQFCVATNAQGGFAVVYRDAALGGPGKGFNNGTHEFDNDGVGGTVNQFVSTPGIEQFGFNLRANTDPLVGANPDQSAALSDLANVNYSTLNRFSYDDSGNPTSLVTKASQTLAARYTLSFVANIADKTPGGTYLAYQIFICTATF